MAKSQKRPGDVTGRRAEVLSAESKEELERRAGEISLMNAQAAEERAEVVDLTATAPEPEPEVNTVEVEVPTRTMRVNCLLEDMTFGQGNNYTFEEGRTYKVTKALYDHLDEKGYVYH